MTNRSKLSKNGGTKARPKRERRKGEDRRAGDRRQGERRGTDRRPHMRDLYKTDLDRHLWSWPKASTRKKKRKKPADRRRLATRLVASAAGMLGAAGLSYLAYKRLRKRGSELEDPLEAQALDDYEDEDEELEEELD